MLKNTIIIILLVSLILFAGSLFVDYIRGSSEVEEIEIKTPKITLSESSFDFGQVEENVGELKHTFKFTNTGKGTLISQDPHGSWGCTAALLDAKYKQLKPNEEGSIQITLNVKGKSGRIEKNVTMITNDPNFNEKNPVNIKIYADIIKK